MVYGRDGSTDVTKIVGKVPLSDGANKKSFTRPHGFSLWWMTIKQCLVHINGMFLYIDACGLRT